MAASDIIIQRGTTKPDSVWKFGDDARPFDGTGSVFVLTVASGSQRIVRRTDDPASGLTFDTATSVLRWTRALADSRKISPGKVGRYEIERFIGGEQSLLISGAVTGKDTISDD